MTVQATVCTLNLQRAAAMLNQTTTTLRISSLLAMDVWAMQMAKVQTATERVRWVPRVRVGRRAGSRALQTVVKVTTMTETTGLQSCLSQNTYTQCMTR